MQVALCENLKYLFQKARNFELGQQKRREMGSRLFLTNILKAVNCSKAVKEYLLSYVYRETACSRATIRK